jgi:hypothetical protein
MVLHFPLRRVSILIVPERDADGWLAVAGSRGWLCGSIEQAGRESKWLARNLHLPIREVVTS